MKKINKKKILVIVCIAIICILIIVGVTVLIKRDKGSSNKDSNSNNSGPKVYTHQVLDVENIDTSQYKSKKDKKAKIAEKYEVNNNMYTVNSDISFDDKKGKMIYVRDGDTKLNVLQVRYDLEHDEDKTEHIQIERIMRDFIMSAKSEMNMFDLDQEPESESLSDKKMPFGEQIYFEKKTYSARYKVKDEHLTEKEIKEQKLEEAEYTSIYDINIYMDGEDTLVCELVKVL